jgi:hypothetical protein
VASEEAPKRTVYDVLRALIDGVMRVGGITDAQHGDLHQTVNDADPEHAAAVERAKHTFTDEEQAQLAALLEKQQEAAAYEGTAAAPAAPSSPVAAAPYPGPVNAPAAPAASPFQQEPGGAGQGGGS